MKRATNAAIAVAVLAGAYLLLSFANLDRFPVVHEDEPYIAATSAHLAATGEYGNPMFAGFYGAEHHVFLHPPLLSLLQAGVFKVSGVSTVSMRVPSVLAGLAVLLLTYAVGTRAGGRACGVLAATVLLVLAPAGGWNGTSGIPLLDIARVARYDILVPAFGLAALLAFESVSRRTIAGTFRFLSGVLAGIATVAHVYGVFWLSALLLVLLLRARPDGGRGRAALQLVTGFALAVLPLAMWILSNWSDFVGQQQLLVERYHVLDPRSLLDNLVSERFRYRPLFALEDPWRSLWSPGLWIVLAGVPVALAFALRTSGPRALRTSGPGAFGLAKSVASDQSFAGQRAGRESTAFAIAIALIVHVALFALLVQVKTYNYLIAVWPLAVLLLAWAGLEVWRARVSESGGLAGGAAKHRTTIVTAFLAFVLVAGVCEGVIRIARWQAGASAATPYASFTQRIAAHVPEGARVLGLQRFWLGPGFDYSSWLLPIWRNDSRFTDSLVPLDVAIERIAPDVILIDDAMQRYFDGLSDLGHPLHTRFLEWRRYIERHSLVPVATVDDVTYGTVSIWR